jgi:hypothetical protein
MTISCTESTLYVCAHSHILTHTHVKAALSAAVELHEDIFKPLHTHISQVHVKWQCYSKQTDLIKGCHVLSRDARVLLCIPCSTHGPCVATGLTRIVHVHQHTIVQIHITKISVRVRKRHERYDKHVRGLENHN